MRVLQAIASGLLGADSFQGGFATAALGLVLHFFIATTATAVYYAASRKLKVLVDQAIICGLAYGIPVYLVMNLIVLPLSAVPFKPPHTLSAIATAVLILMFCIGLPIALTVRRYSKYVMPQAKGGREMENSKGQMIGIGILGFLIGGFVGFLARPSAFLVGQLPFEHVISRGANLKGMDQMLVSLAQQSFNIMLIGAIIGVIAGIVIGYFVEKKKTVQSGT
jgi:hypothetical protein